MAFSIIRHRFRWAVAGAAFSAFIAVLLVVAAFSPVPRDASAQSASVFEGPVSRATCGKGSLPETGLQGQVPRADRDSGRSKRGYRCNLELLGRFQGEGSSWVSQSYGSCAYLSTHFPSGAKSPGVQVIDVGDVRHPRRAGTLTSPAMLGSWESLKVNHKRGLLAAVSAPSPFGNGVGFFDVYDIKTDCRHPRLLNSVSTTELTVPANGLGHEGGWSPDGRTYWGTSGGTLTAIDVRNPSQPRVAFLGNTGTSNHGFGVSRDGTRLYMAEMGNLENTLTEGLALGASAGHGHSHSAASAVGDQSAIQPNGVKIFDVSDIQERKPLPRIREVGRLYWGDGAAGQHAIPITYRGRPHLIFVDELAQGTARIIDISDEGIPRTVSKLRLEIHIPQNASLRDADNDASLPIVYNGHYCTANRHTDPTTLACGYFESGVRVFDIRDPLHPREIGYFNPPAQTGRGADLPSSEHPAYSSNGNSPSLSADWCSSPPRFVGSQLWVTCQDNGFMVLRFTNHAYPMPR